MGKRYLITGAAGFVGYHLADQLLRAGHQVTGVDGMTTYYDVRLKERRLALLNQTPGFQAHECMLEDANRLRAIVEQAAPDVVVHLAAQAGVRYSIENPRAYIDSNIVGSFNIVEICRALKPQHLLLASTSSVYGANSDFPLAENDRADHPLTLYAASKKAVEVMAHSYAHLWGIPTTVFRFFSVYGPWGRPDMALFKFVRAILAGEPIDIYNHGDMERDFTYVDDLVAAVIRLCDKPPAPDDASSGFRGESLSPIAPYRVVNIGGGHPVPLLEFIDEIEAALGRRAKRNYMEMQPGDVRRTEAATELLEGLIGSVPSTPVSVGIREFVRWYRDYYQV